MQHDGFINTSCLYDRGCDGNVCMMGDEREMCWMQGFASGSLERDATAVRLFADAGMELLLSQVATPF